jgi:hypothetical protein
MAKALVLSDDALAEPIIPPQAAQVLAGPGRVAAKPSKVTQVPLQIRIPASDAKAIKRSALEADQTISEFMLACFHASMKK